MYDYILSIKVGDGVNSYYECELTDSRQRKVLLDGDSVCKSRKEVFEWVEKNLPPLWAGRLNESKIDVGKIKEEMKKC
ncbi:MAG: hypothetical protein AAB688_00235 [Patescibacteria group bacterium]